MRREKWLGFALVVNAGLALFACGSRTGFSLDDELPLGPEDAPTDTTRPRDGGRDVAPDAEDDALPPLDVTPNPDVRRNDCPDADATLVYVIGDDNELFSFYPPTLSFVRIGRIACPNARGAGPYSMAVDRKGKGYVVFTDGNLFQVSTATAACVATPFAVNQSGFLTFGMGFVSNNGGPEETLFVAEGKVAAGGPSLGLASIDVGTFKLGFIGPFHPSQSRVEFTGTGDGRLFGFSPSASGSQVIEVDKANANVLASDFVGAGGPGEAFAFAFWGGDFWVFTGSSTTGVFRYRPTDKTTTYMVNAPSRIVGAGVSTCAPQ